MVKKSKSMIMTAKDIPMNAFMAMKVLYSFYVKLIDMFFFKDSSNLISRIFFFFVMKNSAAEKDEKWLQNFLSESLVDDIPWECSKALIILKEGYQAIIPREASRYVLPV